MKKLLSVLFLLSFALASVYAQNIPVSYTHLTLPTTERV